MGSPLDGYRPVVLAVVTLLVFSGVVAVGAGSDAVGTLEYDPETVELAPGEEETVDLALFVGGSAQNVGVDRVNTTLTYDAEALNVTATEPGGWLAGGAGVGVETERKAGAVWVTQTRDWGGATGNGTVLSVTVAVSETATPGSYTLACDDTSVRTVDGHHQHTFTDNATVVVTENSADDSLSGRFTLGVGTVIALLVLAALTTDRVRSD